MYCTTSYSNLSAVLFCFCCCPSFVSIVRVGLVKSKCNNKDPIQIKQFILKEFFVTKGKRGRVAANRQSKISSALEKDEEKIQNGRNTQI